MSRRKVHLVTRPAITLGSTKAYCGRTVYYIPPEADLTAAVANFAAPY